MKKILVISLLLILIGTTFANAEKTDKKYNVLFIAVDDLSHSMEKVRQSGGEVLGEPAAIPGIGDFVMIKDTEGNRVGMLQPLPMEER